MHAKSFGEPLSQVTFVLPDPPSKVGGDAQVQATVPPNRKEEDAKPQSWVPASAGTTMQRDIRIRQNPGCVIPENPSGAWLKSRLFQEQEELPIPGVS